MEELSLQMLRDSDLTLDWQTVFVGWKGFSLHPYWYSSLQSEEARDFAYESLASAVDPEEQQALVGIIDANMNGGFQDAMSRHGETLAARSFVTENTAVCKWRYTKMRHLVGKSFDASWIDNEDLYWDRVAEMVRNWNRLTSTNLVPEAETAKDVLRWLEELHSWLVEEQQRLAQTGQVAESPALTI